MVVNPNEIVDLIMALPKDKQEKAKAYIEKLIKEWDPNFTKLTPAEKHEIEQIQKENDYLPIEDWE